MSISLQVLKPKTPLKTPINRVKNPVNNGENNVKASFCTNTREAINKVKHSVEKSVVGEFRAKYARTREGHDRKTQEKRQEKTS